MPIPTAENLAAFGLSFFIIIYESGHIVPRTDFMRETLNWYVNTWDP